MYMLDAELTEAPLRIDEAVVGRRVVLSVAGEIDICTAEAMRRAIESAAGRAFEIWLDLTATTFMDSTGIHAIATARVRLADANRRLVLICPPGPVLRVITLTGLDQLLEIHPSRSAARERRSSSSAHLA
jgi:anti-sigma B factor antagonist